MDLQVVYRDSNGEPGWEARFGAQSWPCAIGRSGVRETKVEGDGATPAGCWPIRELFYRPDRLARPETVFPCSALRPEDGWCDAPDDPRYNRPVGLPYEARHERLWRDDEIYDCILVLGYNDDPVVPGVGSAIFLHVARPDFAPTEGCVALRRADLLDFLSAAEADTRVCIALP